MRWGQGQDRDGMAMGTGMIQKDGDTGGRSERWSQSGPAECSSGRAQGPLPHPPPRSSGCWSRPEVGGACAHEGLRGAGG